MTSIYVYQKHIDTIHSIVAELPEENSGELATIGGDTYVYVGAGEELPQQPQGIELTLVELTPELRKEIQDHSPHVRLINERVVERIRQKYTENDELKFARLGWQAASGEINDEQVLAELQEYNDHVEGARSWGRSEKTKLGL